MRLKGKTALIAGAGRNCGKAIGLAFAREGADLILVARSGDEVKQVAQECEALGVRALAIPADVTSHEEVNRVAQQGLERFGKVDVLISVVGVRPQKDFWKYSVEEWLQVFAANVHPTFYLAKALAPGMIERKSGSIVALGGMTALTSRPSAAAVAASKHALHGLIKSLALDLGPHGIRANLIALSLIETQRLNPEWYVAPGGDPMTKDQLAHTPLGRFGKLEDVANVALFLASDESSYVTGDRVVCAGGRYM